MYRPGVDENNVQLTDVLCDFCHQVWHEALPLVEGHRGAVICGDCLRDAYRSIIIDKASLAPAGSTCLLCLEVRPDPIWTKPSGPAHPTQGLAAACKRCVNQSAAVLAKDKDFNWKKPV
jgi:bacterioferritin-associated ferredoxin